MKNLVDTSEFAQVFDVKLQRILKLQEDETNQGRVLCSRDRWCDNRAWCRFINYNDPHSEQDALSETAMDSAYEWYTSGPRQRLQPGGAIVIVMTRWSTKDLTGNLLRAQSEPKADQWEVVGFQLSCQVKNQYGLTIGS